MPKKINITPGISKRGERWQARAFHFGKEKSKTFSTKDEAVRWKRETERALERGEWIDPTQSNISFAEWSEHWLEAKTNIAPSTRAGYKARLKSHLIPAFGSRKLTSITNNEIGKWIASSISNGIGMVAIKQSYGVLRQIMTAAVLDGRLNRNPALGVKLPRVKSKEKLVFSIEQLRALADACSQHKPVVLLAGTTGMRWGEIVALQCKDVSVLNRNIRVSKSISLDEDGKKTVGSTKTHQERTIPVPKEVIELLTPIIQSKAPEQLLFQMEKGGQMDYNNFMSRVFRPALASLGFDGYSFHSLRHTTASLLISQGTPITTVAGILGHASTQMTLDVYGHLYENDASKYVDRLGDSLFGMGTDKERTNVLQVKAQS